MRLVVLAALTTTASATTGFNFGRGSGIIVQDGGTLDLSEGIEITDGFIERNPGGTIETDCSDIVGNNATWIEKDGDNGEYYSSITFDGALRDGYKVILGNSDSSIMHGAGVSARVVAEGSHSAPSVLRGTAGSGNSVRIESGAKLLCDLAGVLGSSIRLRADQEYYSLSNPDGAKATLSLDSDLTFVPLCGPQSYYGGLNTIEFNGHRISLGGDSDSFSETFGAFTIYEPQLWREANVTLFGPLMLKNDGNITFSDAGSINGAGNTLYINTLSTGLRNSCNDIALIDLIISDSTNNGLENNCGSWKCVNTSFITEQGSITIDGSFSHSNNVFNGASFGHASTVYYTSAGDYTPLLDLASAPVTAAIVGFDSRAVYVDDESGVLFVFDANSARVKVEMTATAQLFDDSLVNDSGARSLWRFDKNGVAIYVDTNGAFSVSSGFNYVLASVLYSVALDDNSWPVLVEHYEPSYEFEHDNLYAPTGSNVTDLTPISDQFPDVYFDYTTDTIFEFDADHNPVKVDINATLVRDGDDNLVPGSNSYTQWRVNKGNDIYVDLYDVDGNAIYYDNNDTSVFIRMINMTGYQVTLSYSPSNQVTYFNHTNATVRLNSNVWLSGYWKAIEGTVLTIDLNGHTLDISDGSIGCSDSYATVVVKNGVLAGVGCSSLDFESNSTLILDNVELRIDGEAKWRYAEMIIQGKCRLVGNEGSLFENRSSADFIISTDATLTLEDGVIYSHRNSGTDNFVFQSNSSRLELIGATFRRPNQCGDCAPLELTVGTLILDHKVNIQPGSDHMQFGGGGDSDNNLSIIMRPGATLSIGSNSDANVSSGTIYYANYTDC